MEFRFYWSFRSSAARKTTKRHFDDLSLLVLGLRSGTSVKIALWLQVCSSVHDGCIDCVRLGGEGVGLRTAARCAGLEPYQVLKSIDRFSLMLFLYLCLTATVLLVFIYVYASKVQFDLTVLWKLFFIANQNWVLAKNWKHLWYWSYIQSQLCDVEWKTVVDLTEAPQHLGGGGGVSQISTFEKAACQHRNFTQSGCCWWHRGPLIVEDLLEMFDWWTSVTGPPPPPPKSSEEI